MAQKQIQSRRTPSTEAVKIVIDTLHQNPSNPMTIQDIARRTNLNRRTVEKAIDVLKYVYDRSSHEDLIAFRSGGANFIEVKSNGKKNQLGLLDLPDNVQRLVIRTAYFPTPSEEEFVLIHLLMQRAETPELAAKLELTPTVLTLLKQENIAKASRGTFYLTEVGGIIAKGALSTYPELEGVARTQSEPPTPRADVQLK